MYLCVFLCLFVYIGIHGSLSPFILSQQRHVNLGIHCYTDEIFNNKNF